MSTESNRVKHQKAKQRRLALARGEGGAVDPTPTVRHLKALRAAGIAWPALGKATGINPASLGYIVKGRRQYVQRATERAVLAVPLPSASGLRSPRHLVPAGPTVRRYQALLALGWRRQDHPALKGLRNLSMTDACFVHAKTEKAVKDCYDALSGTPGPSRRVALGSLKRGYAPPLAWNNIEDMSEKPQGAGWKDPVTGRGRSAEALAEDVAFLRSQGLSEAAALDRLGVSLEAWEQAKSRMRKKQVKGQG